MLVLMWIAALFGLWCVASVVTALAFGSILRRRREATDPHGALRPLDVGPLNLWVNTIPETPADVLDEVERLPIPRTPGDRVAVRDTETAGR